MNKITDKFNRPMRDLRISVTDRCNFRCTYCMPKEVYGEAYRFLPKEELLNFDEIERITKLFANLGVSKLRITGGEPLVRKNIENLISRLSKIKGITDIAMTTNGYLLKEKVNILKSSGLNRLTVSLDAIDNETFQKMSDQKFDVNKVLDAIDYANNNGFKQIKINCVVKKGTNEHAIIDLITHFKNSDNIVRFIEYMDVGNINGWNKEDVLSLKDIITIIENKFELYKVEPNYLGEVANRYRFKNGKGEIGIISSVSKPFCHSCTRSRITMDGKFVTCLFANEGLDLRKPIRDDLTDTEILKIISDAWMIRDDRYSEIRSNLNNTSNKKKKIEMFQLGG